MHILIVNVHSARNLGDAGIMQATLDALRRRYPHARICIAANDPQSWQPAEEQGAGADQVLPSLATWFGDPALGRWRPHFTLALLWLPLLLLVGLAFRLGGLRWRFGAASQRALLDAYFMADLVLSCGGGNFYAARALSPGLLTALWTLALPIVMGKRVTLLPQSLGPIQGGMQRSLARWVFNRAGRVYVREPASQEFARNVLRLDVIPRLLPDLALGLPAVPAATLAGRCKVGITPLDRAAQHPGFTGQAAYEAALLAAARRVHTGQGAHIYLFCQCTGPSPDQDDRHIARRLHAQLHAEGIPVTLVAEFDSVAGLQAAYAAMDLVIATRMHGAIFALTGGAPTIALGYQPKSCGLMQMLELAEYCIPLEEITSAGLAEQAAAVLRKPEPIRQQAAAAHQWARTVLADWVEQLET